MTDRRLAAIVVADVAGYSRLMHAAEEQTHTQLARIMSDAIAPVIAEYGGRIVKTTGDGFLAEFASAVMAVKCVLAFQAAVAGRMLSADAPDQIAFRVGVHVGDVIAQDDDIYGDGVNIAARLEAIAEPGGIAISAPVHENVLGRVPCDFEDLGEQALKNISRPVHVFRVVSIETKARPTLALPDKPSIAVLPFQNMSADPEQEYFADGMVEDIITALSRVRWLFVIARNSSFAYKSKMVDVRQIGRELGVRYVLEGSVRRAGDRIRITGQLIDALDGAHIWADRFDALLGDVFDLQDRLTDSVMAAIEPKLRSAEIARAQRKPAGNLQAYDLLLRAQPYRWSFDAAGVRQAIGLLEEATKIDPGYALGFAHLAHCYWTRVAQGWQGEAAVAINAARRAVRLAGDDPEVLWIAAYVIALGDGALDEGIALAERSATLSANAAGAFRVSGMLRAFAGDTDRAIVDLERALRLNPIDLAAFTSFGFAVAHFVAGRYEMTLEWTEKGLRHQPHHAPTLRYRAASLGLLDRAEQGRQAIERLLAVAPGYTVARARAFIEADMHNPFKTSGIVDRFCDGLRRAGLPDI